VTDRDVFEARVVPHLDAAYNLARWLLREARAAEDAVQESALRAFRYLGSLHSNEAKPWLLGIVRNTCYSALARLRQTPELTGFDEQELELLQDAADVDHADPADALQRTRQRVDINVALQALSPPLREVIVLRELEELDYAEIAKIVAVPIGTVMSRLSRARAQLREALRQSGLDP
jgi:RNA polymerase sigma-70 factor (ECF subfamily)